MNWKKKLTACTLLACITAIILGIINKLIGFFASFDPLLKESDGEFYEWHFGKIFYIKKGTGSPILLVHDLTAQSSAFEYSCLIDELAKTNTVYAVDLLGCGRSDKPNLTYTNFLYVQMLTDFIKHIIGHKTDVVVSGESCSSILMLACNNNTIVNRIILVSPCNINYLSLVPNKRTKILKFLINSPIIGTTIYNMVLTRPSIERLFFVDYFYNCIYIKKDYIKTYYQSAHTKFSKSKYLFASIKGRYTNANIAHCLKSLNNSIFILGSKNSLDHLITANQYKELLPSIELIELSRCRHLPQLEIPHEFIEILRIILEVEE